MIIFDLQRFANNASITGGSSEGYFLVGDVNTKPGTKYTAASGTTFNVPTGYGTSGTSVYASYWAGTLAVAGSSNLTVNVGASDSYVFTVGTIGTASAGTPGGIGTAGEVGSGEDGTVTIFGVTTDFDGGNYTITNGSLSSIGGGGKMSISTGNARAAGDNMQLEVASLSTDTGLLFAGTDVKVQYATGTFKYNSTSDAFVYEATTDSAGQKIDLSKQSALWSVKGGKGRDTIVSGSKGADTLYGGAGDDSIVITDGNSDGVYVYGDEGNDSVLFGSGARAVVNLGAGNDTFVGTNLTDVTIVGGEGNDSVSVGTAVNGVVSLGGGADTVVIGGTSTVYGGEGADVFEAGTAVGTASVITIGDYTLNEDVISVAAGKVTALGTSGTALVGATVGTAVTGGAQVVLNAVGGNYYAAEFKDNQGSQYVGWVGENDAATIDASSLNRNTILVGLGNGDTGDVLTGGARSDTIHAGVNDTIDGGAGNDVLFLTGTNGSITVNANGASGNDTINGFAAGFTEGESDAFQLAGLTSARLIKVNYDGNRNATIKGGKATLNVSFDTNANSANENYAEMLINGQKAAAIKKGSTYTVTDAHDADYFYGDNSGVSYSDVQDDIEVNLGNTEKFYGVNTLRGGAASSTLMGSSGKETIIASAGVTSLWGGAGADSLVGNTASEDMFFFLGGDGKDSISSFGVYNEAGSDNDTLNTFGSGITKALRTGNGTVKVTVNGSASDVLTLQTTGGTGNGADDKIQFTDGTNKGIAKIGYNTASTFAYDTDVTVYMGGAGKDTVSISSANNDDLLVWLDGSKGTLYSSVEVIANNGTGNSQLAGDAASQSIQAGSGNDSLWGGGGAAADTLTGGIGSNTFFYGLGEGKDVLQNVGEDDLVNLFNINLSQVASADIGSSAISVTTTAGETLTVARASGAATTTFQLSDGTKWAANWSGKNWEQA